MICVSQYTGKTCVLWYCDAMGIRPHSFAIGELYHCYNRGIEKRVVFNNSDDFLYFLNGLYLYNNNLETDTKMRYFNESDVINKYNKKNKLVDIHAYCLNKNHFHLLLEELVDGGISKFMQKIATSYVMYFNKKNERSGSLFQGKFKSVHIDTDVYLKHLGVYINLNNLVHNVKDANKYRSSIHEYVSDKKGLCNTSLLNSFSNGLEYEKYAYNVLPDILERKKMLKNLTYSEFID